ncbi:hypothetical protein F4678DRAFT_85060 [Xylaria arbuscula]|nr:hypothetical protein F4678DRAFT_85060 [Xylaria arbuscula]
MIVVHLWVGGPEMAWKALIEVTALCIYDWDSSDVRFYGEGEEDCDGFHDKSDVLMRLICETQKENGKISWLRDGRKEEILRLQQKAQSYKDNTWGRRYKAQGNERKPFAYRYQTTLEFLEQL